MTNIIDKCIKQITRFPKTIVVVAILITVALAIPLRNFEMETDQKKAFIDQKDPLVMVENRANELFGGDVQFMPFFLQSAQDGDEENTNMLSDENLQGIKKVIAVFDHEDIKPYLKNAGQVFPAQIPEENAAKMVAAQLKQMPEELLGGMFSSDFKFNEDGTAYATTVLLSGAGDIDKLNEDSVDPIDFDILADEKVKEAGENLHIVTLATGVIQQEIAGSNSEAGMFFAISLALIVILLAFIVRKIRYIVFSLAIIAMAVTWTFGLITLFGIPASMLIMFAPILVLALGIDYIIHFFARLREERETQDMKPAMWQTVRHTGLAVFMAMVTTGIAFSANAIAPSPALIGFGLGIAIGVFIMFILTFTVLPALVTWLGVKNPKPKKNKDKSPLLERILGKISVYLEKYSVAVMILVVIGFGLATWQALNVNTTFDMKEFLAEDSQALEAMELVENDFGGTDSRQEMVLIEGDILNEDVLISIKKTANNLDELGNVQTLFTYLPPNTTAAAAIQMLENAPVEMQEQLKSIVHFGDGDVAVDATRILIALDPDKAMDMETALADFVVATEKLDQHEDIEYSATGEIHQGDHMVKQLNRALYQSVGIALVAAFILLLISLRKFGLALIGLIPVIFVAVMVVGSMTIMGVSLNAITMLIASMSIGISVDFSIHILQRLSEELKRKKSMREAINIAVKRTGAALAETSITTFIGFGVLAFSSFAFFKNFGIVSSLMIVYSLIISIAFVPAILWIRHRILKKREERKNR